MTRWVTPSSSRWVTWRTWVQAQVPGRVGGGSLRGGARRCASAGWAASASRARSRAFFMVTPVPLMHRPARSGIDFRGQRSRCAPSPEGSPAGSRPRQLARASGPLNLQPRRGTVLTAPACDACPDPPEVSGLNAPHRTFVPAGRTVRPAHVESNMDRAQKQRDGRGAEADVQRDQRGGRHPQSRPDGGPVHRFEEPDARRRRRLQGHQEPARPDRARRHAATRP